jgi:CDP-glycerol glycerophosphotransferase (TagB/SpsB family)
MDIHNKGRSLKDKLKFDGLTNDYEIGFVSREEYMILKNKIIFYFGDSETMREKYSTIRERTELENAINNSNDGSYSLSGLEYVLDALNELTDKNKELITGIE